MGTDATRCRRCFLRMELAMVLFSGAVAGEAEQAAGPLRTLRYTRRRAGGARRWQRDVRMRLQTLLKIDGLTGTAIPLYPKLVSKEGKEGYTLSELEISSTPARRIRVLVTMSLPARGPVPAVVCIHGHGGTRRTVQDPATVYKGFAQALARDGVVTIAADVGQHKVCDPGRLPIGERLWDLMRCVDYLEGRKSLS